MRIHRPEWTIAPGNIIRVCSESEAQAFAAQWIDVYARNTLGANIGAYLWHSFSAHRYPSVSGQEALHLYHQQHASELVVLSNDRRSAVLTDALPTQCSSSDYCVFPENLAWTMAFTHEEGWLGPFFARHANYSTLTAQNHLQFVERKRKAQQLERARKMGWV